MVALYLDVGETPGGAERRLLRIFNEIAGEREDVNLLVRGTSKNLESFLRANIGEIKYRKTVLFNNTRLCRLNIYKHIIKERYKVVVYFNGSKFTADLNKIAGLFGIKTLMVIASGAVAYNLTLCVYRGKMKQYIDRTIKTASHIDCLYPNAEQGLRERFPHKEISITPGSFTDLEKFKPGVKEKIMTFSAARLDETKNPHLLIDAINIIQDKVREFEYKVLICGDGFDRELLEKRSIKNGTDDIIKFLGFVNTADYLPKTEVYFSLQYFDNYPSQALLEAISCGCYIIATNVGATSALADGIAFSTLVNNDERELANAILDYVSYPETRKDDCSQLARVFAENNLSIDKSVIYFSDIISTLADK